MKITIDIPNPPSEQRIINIPIHFCGGQVVDANGYGFEERKTGKWIGDNGKEVFLDEFGNTEHSSTCSVCGDWLIGSDEYACRGRYCPNCGAKMEGAEE